LKAVDGARGGAGSSAPFHLRLAVCGGKIAEIDILSDPARLRQLDLTVLSG
jgi:hypothetical protein